MAVSPARAVAFDILQEVEARQSFAVDLLHSRRTVELSPADQALCMQLVMGVLRWQSNLDAAIASVATTKLDLEIRLALRLALFQMRFLDRIPQRAAVNESVELAKRARKRSAAPFVNAVLRKLATVKIEEEGTLAARLAHPQWMVQRWIAQYGAESAAAICRFDQSPPEAALRLRSSDHQAVEAELAASGIQLAPGRLLANARLLLAGDVSQTRAFQEGRVAIQDEGSQLVAMLVGDGKRILDCCAAPGGKTAAIADRNPQAQITAVELHPHRWRLLRKMVKAANVDCVNTDVTQMPGDASFDCVLADVPCSGTGTLARNPEIKWRLTESDLADLSARQSAILDAALGRLELGGRLVYSTCSLEQEECQQVVEHVLAQRAGFHVVDCAKRLQEFRRSGDLLCWSAKEPLTEGPYLRTIPGVHPCDGFFAATIKREG